MSQGHFVLCVPQVRRHTKSFGAFVTGIDFQTLGQRGFLNSSSIHAVAEAMFNLKLADTRT